MPTDFSYFFSDRANQEIDTKLAYIEKHWNKKTANKFWIDLIQRIDLITRNPTAFKKSDKYHGVRRSVLLKRAIN